MADSRIESTGIESTGDADLVALAEPRHHNGWLVTVTTGSADAFHNDHPGVDPEPAIRIHRPGGPALVLGSTQPDALVNREAAAAAGIEVCRRRSGGGLVHIDPATDCWVDVIVPRNSSHWNDDVGRAFHWLGRHWAAVLAAPPHRLQTVVATASSTTPAGRVWCYADLGHGELSIDGAKVLGLSQRRTRTWTRLQGLVLGRWPGAELRRYVNLDVLTSTDRQRFPDRSALDPALVSAGVPPYLQRFDPSALATDFVERIPPA